MTPSRDEVLRMAREAGVSTNTRSIWPPTFKHSFDFTEEQLERFAALVADHAAAAEREACALAVEVKVDRWSSVDDDTASALQAAACAIRARSTV